MCYSVVSVVAAFVVVVPLAHSLWLPTATNIPSAAVWPTAPPSAKMGLRRQLRRLDLRDAVQKKPVLEKPAYRARVQRVMKTAKSKAVAQAIIKGFRKTCQEVVESGGMAARKG